MKLSEITLLPADVILTRSESFIGRAIRAFSLMASGGARVNHAAIVVSPTELVESLWRVRRNPVSIYDGTEYVVWRHHGLSMVERMLVANEAARLVGGHYGVGKIALFALDCLASSLGWNGNWFTDHGITRFKVCSQAVGFCYQNKLRRHVLGGDWWNLSPDRIDDHCLEDRDWEMIACTMRPNS